MKEREIDLLDMIADILSHWRGLLIAIVLGAVLLGAFSYTRSYRNMQNMQNMQSQEAENTSEDEMAIEEKLAQLSENLDDSQLTAVLTTVEEAICAGFHLYAVRSYECCTGGTDLQYSGKK